MKKLFGLVLGLAVILGGCVFVKSFAYGEDSSAKLQEFKKSQAEIKKYVPYYNNLATCTPYKTDLYKIYGKVNGACHLYMVDNAGKSYDCKVPMAVAGVNSSYGKRVFTKMATVDLEHLDYNNIEQFMREFTQILEDLQTLAKMESTMLQHHCKKQ